MTDDVNMKTSEPTEEKEQPKKVHEEMENPKQHGSEVHAELVVPSADD